jgi:hypothetical protein
LPLVARTGSTDKPGSASRNTASATSGNVARAFGKMDKNDDDQISRVEFGAELD